MKRKILLIIGFVMIALQAMAQGENKNKILNNEKNQTIINQELINQSVQSTGVDAQLMFLNNNEPKKTFDTTAISNLKLDLSPINNSNRGFFPFYKNISFYLESEQKRYLNLASYNLAYMAVGWGLNSKLNLTGGLLAVKQFTNQVPYGFDRSGARLNLSYSITNQLEFNMWGQYITGSSINSANDFLLPQTGTGAAVILNLGGASQVGVGAEYQYDDKKEKWNYQSGGKLKLKF